MYKKVESKYINFRVKDEEEEMESDNKDLPLAC